MSWIKLLDNAHFLETLFPNAAPPLASIRVHRVQLHQDGPVLLLDFDLKQYPVSPPTKWLASGFNTVQVRLMGIDVRELGMTGWSTSNVGQLELARNAESTTLQFIAPKCSIHAELELIRVERVSAYYDEAT